jgi:anti-anti-sigma factor
MSAPNVFQVEREGPTLVVTPQGSVSSLAAGTLQPEIDALLGEIAVGDVRSVVFDLAEVTYFGSLMLSAIQSVWKRLRPAQGKVALCNVSDLGRDILRIARFDLLWPVYASRQEALDAVRPDAPA